MIWLFYLARTENVEVCDCTIVFDESFEKVLKEVGDVFVAV